MGGVKKRKGGRRSKIYVGVLATIMDFMCPDCNTQTDVLQSFRDENACCDKCWFIIIPASAKPDKERRIFLWEGGFGVMHVNRDGFCW
jgi:hypothetical protein